jgi:hypothetical protein
MSLRHGVDSTAASVRVGRTGHEHVMLLLPVAPNVPLTG